MSDSTKQNKILAFYLGQQPDSQGRAIEDMWSWDYQKLESVHNYIQWLFPLREKSRFNSSAPTLNDEVIQAFRTTEELRSRLVKSLKVMLAFYGLECREGENAEIVIAKSEEYLSRKREWIEPFNHNYLRLTRILTSLTNLGLKNYALALFRCLDEIYNENKEIIGLKTYTYWKNAVNS
ncbi:opioid growth factor receptor-related protein [Microcoleus sp. B3-D7]|uniref:opioid growth factor receptor-related protein n=1 Tax=Microcoleus sp. B3-D7 TaxID=2818659 RepID=UPI002FD6AEE1